MKPQSNLPSEPSAYHGAIDFEEIAAQSEYASMWLDLQAEAVDFKARLGELGYRPVESPMHYFLMAVGDGRLWRQRLLEAGLLVRLCESYDLANYVRLSTQLPEQNRRLLNLLQSFQDSSKE